MDFAESTEQQELRRAVGAITDKYGPQYYAERAVAHEPTTELWKDLADHGFIGINFPEEYGGGGAGMTELAIVCEETAAHGCPQLLLLVSSAISGELLTKYGTDAQRREWLPRMAAGTTKVVFAITEPDAGSNSHQISTIARRDGSDYVLNGTKYYISGVDEAGALIVVARTGRDESSGAARMSLFLVPTDTPGLPTSRSTRRPKPPSPPSTRQSRSTAETVSAPSTRYSPSGGWPACFASPRSAER